MHCFHPNLKTGIEQLCHETAVSELSHTRTHARTHGCNAFVMEMIDSIYLSIKYCIALRTHSLCQNMNLLVHAHCFFVCLIYFVLQFYVSLFSCKTTIYNCMFHALRLPQMSPTGTLCLAVAPLHRLPKTRIALGFSCYSFLL